MDSESFNEDSKPCANFRGHSVVCVEDAVDVNVGPWIIGRTFGDIGRPQDILVDFHASPAESQNTHATGKSVHISC
jgi:hypothetical protein